MLDFLGHLYSPGSKRDSLAGFENKRLPRARFLDWDEVPDLGHPLKLRHMMPSASVFARACSKNAFRGLLIRFCNVVDALSRGTRYHSRVSCCPVSRCNDGWCSRPYSATLCCVIIDMILLACSPHVAPCSGSRFICYPDPCIPRSHVVKHTNLLIGLSIWT